jgi:hypothetical protein
MIEKAATLAKTRGWDFDILSPLQLAVAIPSPRWQFYHALHIFCSIQGGAWCFVAIKEFEVLVEQDPEVRFTWADYDGFLRLTKSIYYLPRNA